MASPYVKNLVINGGVDFVQTLTFSNDTGPTDFTDYTIESHLRKTAASTTYKAFTITSPNPTTGEIKMTMDAADTASLTPGRYVYDILFDDTLNSKKSVLLEGTVLVRAGISTGCF